MKSLLEINVIGIVSYLSSVTAFRMLLRNGFVKPELESSLTKLLERAVRESLALKPSAVPTNSKRGNALILFPMIAYGTL